MRALILAIIILLPSYVIRFQIGPFPTTLLEMLLLVLFIVWIVHTWNITPSNSPLKRGRELAEKIWAIIPTSLRMPLVLFLLAGTISVFAAPDLRAAAGLWRAYIVEPILFFVIFLDVAREWKTVFHDVIMALGISALLVSTVAIYQYFIPSGLTIFGNTYFAIPNAFWFAEATRRVTSIFGFPNAIGLYLAPITVLLIGWMVTRRPHPNPLLLGEGIHTESAGVAQGLHNKVASFLLFLTALASILAMYFAKSEGALIATAAGLTFLGLTYAPLRRWTIGILACAFVLILLFPSTRIYATNALTFNFDSGSIRLLQWKDTVRMLADRPIFGAGLSGYPTRFAPYHSAASYIEVYQYPHNIILNFWSEMGLLGVIAFGWIVVWFFRLSLRGVKRGPPTGDLPQGDNLGDRFASLAMTAVVASAMTTILIHGIVDVPYFKNDLAIFFWLLVALMVIETQTHTQHENA